ncbi:MAG TPA: MBL fold metallo-hydrolase, partial [Limnochordales bacterium]
MFVHGPDLLIDTSEDIYLQLDRARLGHIHGGLYSHWHPDHTMGRRVWETLNADPRGMPPRHRRSEVYVPTGVLEDFERYGLMPHFDFLARRFIDLIPMQPKRPYVINGYTVTAIPLAMERAYAFLLEAPGHGPDALRVLVAMDETKGWSPPPAVRGVHLAVIPVGIFEFDPFTGERRMPPEHPLLREEATFDETLALVAALGGDASEEARAHRPGLLDLVHSA